MNPRVVVLGDLMADVVVRPLAPTALTSDTPSTVRLSRGGAAANVAVALAATGCEVHYIAAVGRDALGDAVLAELRDDHVSARVVRLDAPTGVVVALIAPDAQRAMFTDRGANAHLTKAAALELLDGEFDHLHLSGYTLLGEETRDVGQAVIRAARQRHWGVSVDACSLGPLLAMGAEKFLDAASGATTLFANKEEALALSTTSDVDEALERLLFRFNEVVITCGADGAVAGRETDRARAEAVATRVIDTTGAGDAATGAYLAARLRQESLDVALADAMASSAGVIGALGSRGQSRL